MTVIIFGVLATAVAFISVTMPGPITQASIHDVIVRPQSTVEYTSIASVSTVDCGLTNLIHQMLSGCV